MTPPLTVTADEQERDREHTAAPSEEATDCPECNGRITTQEDRGERLCEDCGLVLKEESIDYGPDWRSFSDDETDRRRIGAPVTELLHDKGLSTTIGWRDKDAYGNTLSSKKRERIHRLRTWDERFRTKSSQERNLKQALGEIERMSSALGLADPPRETAAVLYRRAVEEGLLPGRSIESMATASLYAAARQHDTPRALATFDSVSRVEKLEIQRAYRYLSQELGLSIEPADPVHYLRQYVSNADVSSEVERIARDLLETGKEQGVHSGKSPPGLAGAAIYAAAQLANEQLTQATVSQAAGVSEVTIRNRYQELLEVYGEHRA
ncbi:transcription initiation factor IIB family protein [Halorubrum sp. SD683]|uniref:transcription initiation factor IIB n=1 Tax=Halorubrum sp. SD683 TaxID=1855873 RepID=UPI000A2E5D8C|nr:TFIIB-type zinc ribbon-containing protein [Halorubrum sp. SD683]OTF01845.1 transcription initiation factor IIB 2 [Halorubrum sp. SD683]